jgi:hypothetical protein
MRWDTELRIAGPGELDDDFFDALAQALGDLEKRDPEIEDVDLTAALAEGWIQVTMAVVDQSDLMRVAEKTIATARTALHQIGQSTPGWEKLTELVREECMALKPADDNELVDA